MQGLGQKMAKGAVWMLLFKLGDRSLGLISTIILARLLMPEDFGLVAMAMSIISVLELLSAFNFDVVIIQNPNAERQHYDTAWTFNVLVASASAVLLLLLAIPAAHFYHEPRLEIVMYCLAIGFLAQGFENIGVVAFRKELDFNKEFKFLFGKKLISFCVTVPLAFYLQNYWALVIGMVTGKLAGVALTYAVQSYRPRFSLQARHELFHFSKWLLFNNILSFLRYRVADFIIGRVSGTHSLGIFNVAFEISNLPTTEMIAPINRAVFPGYAKMAHDITVLRQGFINVIAVIALFAMPAGLGIAAIAELIVKVFLGDKWLDAIPVIQVLAFFGSVTALQTNLMSVFLAIKKPKKLSVLISLQLIILIPMLIISTIKFGMIGAAWSYLIAAIAILPVGYFMTFKEIQLKFSRFIGTVWRPILAAVIMHFTVKSGITFAAQSLHITSDILLLFSSILLGAISYIGIILVLWLLCSRPDGAEQYILDKAREIYQAKFKNKPAV